MATKWSDDLSIGVDAIDTQHKGIFTRVGSLLAAMGQGKGKDEIGKVLTYLADYVVKHFGAEEALMTKYNYSDYSKQKAEHTQFIKDFSALKKEFEAEGATSHLVIKTQRQLCDWLTKHITNEDKKFGTFLKNEGHG